MRLKKYRDQGFVLVIFLIASWIMFISQKTPHRKVKDDSVRQFSVDGIAIDMDENQLPFRPQQMRLINVKGQSGSPIEVWTVSPDVSVALATDGGRKRVASVSGKKLSSLGSIVAMVGEDYNVVRQRFREFDFRHIDYDFPEGPSDPRLGILSIDFRDGTVKVTTENGSVLGCSIESHHLQSQWPRHFVREVR